MGHRALVAYEQTDGTYNLHQSQWGGINLRLRQEITPETPFGKDESSNAVSNLVLGHLQQATEEASRSETSETSQPSTEVDSNPITEGVSFDEAISEYLDYQRHEAFYLIPRTFQVIAYRTFWLGFSSVAESVSRSLKIGHGVIVTVRWYEGIAVDDGYLRGWFDGSKEIMAELIDRKMFTTSQATTYLLERFIDQLNPHSEYHIRRRDQ